MAQNFKNARRVLTTSAETVYTVPALTTAIVIGCQVTNVGTATYDLTLSWLDSSNANAETRIAQGIPVPDASAYEPIGGKLVLEAGDVIRGFANANTALEVTVSVLEIS